MEIIPAQLAKNQFGDLLMKVQREPVEISKRVAVVTSVLSDAIDFDVPGAEPVIQEAANM